MKSAWEENGWNGTVQKRYMKSFFSVKSRESTYWIALCLNQMFVPILAPLSEGHREKWIIQGHIGSIWENGQYTRTRDMKKVIPAFEDLLLRLRTDYIDLGMIHYIDEPAEFHRVMRGDFFSYIEQLKARKTIRHIGLSTHNPEVASLAVQSKKIEVILFSINPAFDMLPPTENLEDYYSLHTYQNHQELRGIAPERVELYKNCEKAGVGITVMKGYGRRQAVFGADLSFWCLFNCSVQCLHYALTRPAVSSVIGRIRICPSGKRSCCLRNRFGGSQRLCNSFVTGTCTCLLWPMYLLWSLRSLSSRH